MTDTNGRKMFCGNRVRALRIAHELSQRMMAQRLTISASYLNQIENNVKPVPTRLLMTLCDMFSVAPSYFGDDGEIRMLRLLREASSDPMFRSSLPEREIHGAIRDNPAFVRMFLELYRSVRAMHEQGSEIQPDKRTEAERVSAWSKLSSAYEIVGDWVQAERNYFDTLDRTAEQLFETARLETDTIGAGLERYLRDRFGVKISSATAEPVAGNGSPCHFDSADKRVRFNPGLPGPTRTFCMARLIAHLGYSTLIDEAARHPLLSDENTRSIARAAMANYFAGGLIMPYELFAAKAKAFKHDLDHLQTTFSASYEQVCQRLSSLQRPGAEGVPFYFIKADVAGNVLKSYSANRFSRARFGALCPRWNVFESFSAAGKLIIQISQDTEGGLFISVARAVVSHPLSFFDRQPKRAIVLGCSVAHADEVVYSSMLNLHDPRTFISIGPGCRSCVRADCEHRAMPQSGFFFQPAAGG
ncbi:helix-turn-helix domain-containing protein [Gluconacetobacter sacchari]|uniref:helix-turn-helix domain-containing protein n=1 Tax=Gluconacetobacter sacchari TaxID=92759 RepID=UPI0039B6DF58